MKQTHFTHELVEFIPEQLKEGTLYISYKYGTAVHKCACGCGEEVVTPLNPTDWSVRIDANGPTLYPSVGNWSFACRSHYLIRGGRVIWARPMTRQQIEQGRAHDHAAKEAYFAQVSRERFGIFTRVWEWLKRWWTSLIG